MANINAPIGGNILGTLISAAYTAKSHKYIIPASDLNNLYTNDFVKFATGSNSDGIPYITKANAGDKLLGTAMDIRNIITNEQYTYRKAGEERLVHVIDDPYIEIEIQANGILSTNDIGKFADIIVSNGDINIGISHTQLDISTLNTISGQLKILSILETTNNTLGLYAKVRCIIADHALKDLGENIFDRDPVTGDITTSHPGDNLIIDGKLTVGGLIDPTGVVVTPQVTPPSLDNGTYYYNSTLKAFQFRADGKWLNLPQPYPVINISSDFPIPADVYLGETFRIGTNVTDNDPSRTNTGQSFIAGEEIFWNGTNWTVYGDTSLWADNLTDLYPVSSGRNINLLTGGLKDNNVTTAVKLGDTLNTSFNTTNKTIIGSLNEAYQWDRVDLGAGDWWLKPHTATDGLLVGSVAGDAFGFKGTFLEVGNAVNNTGITVRTSGLTDFDYLGGVSTSNTYVLKLENMSNAASMAGTENGIYFTQYYYDAVTPLGRDEGYLGFGTEGNWTSTASTQDGYFIVRVPQNGVLVDGIKVNSDQTVTLKNNINIYAYTGATLNNTVTLGYNSSGHQIGQLIVNSTDTWAYLDVDIYSASTSAYLYIGRNNSAVTGRYLYNYHLQRNIQTGTIASYVNVLETWNEIASGADLTGTMSTIEMDQRIPGGSISALGRFGYVCEGTWQGSAGTRSSGFAVYVKSADVIGLGMYLQHDKSINFYGTTTISDGTNSIILYATGVQGNLFTTAVSTANTTGLYLIQQAHDASMIATENGIYFEQKYHGGSASPMREGYIGFGTETNWTGTSSTQNSYFIGRAVYQGNFVDVLKISSAAIPQFPGLTTSGGIMQTTSTGVVSSSNTVSAATTFSANTTFSSNIYGASSTAIWLGDSSVDGSWWCGRQGTDIVWGRKESGLNINKMLLRDTGVLTTLGHGFFHASAPTDPNPSYAYFYLDSLADVLIYKVNHSGSAVTAFQLNATGVPTFPGLNVAGGIIQSDSNGTLSSSTTLSNGTIATTQSANDNSTKLATTAYIDGKTSFAAGLSLSGDLAVGSANHVYYGASGTDGTWETVRSSNDLIFARRESSAYVTKLTIASTGVVTALGSLIVPLASRLIIGPDAVDGSFSFVVSGGHVYAQKYGSGTWGGAGQFLIL
jgi:hypothetical protein